MNNETLLVIFVGITGFALLVQAIVMLMAFLTMRKTVVSLQSDVRELRVSAMPIIEKSRDTLEKLAPRIESVSTDITEVVHRSASSLIISKLSPAMCSIVYTVRPAASTTCSQAWWTA